MNTFYEHMKKRHEEAVADFGMPERVILSEDVKLWRFTGKIDHVGKIEHFAWPELVPVFSGNKQIGAATIFPKNLPSGEVDLIASATATHDLPERLDFENGEMFTLMPETEYTEDSVRKIKRLELLKNSNFPDYAISTWEEF